jgi:hypothetical protein
MSEIKGKDYLYKKFERQYELSQLPEIEIKSKVIKEKKKLPYNKHCKELLEKEKSEFFLSQLKNEEIKNKIVKRNAYAKMAKILHWPEVSTEKKQQMVEMKQKLSKSPNRSKQKQDGLVAYASFDKAKQSILGVQSQKSKLKVSKIKWGKSLYTEEKEKKKLKDQKVEYKDYLKEFKHKRKGHKTPGSDDENQAFHPYYDWKSINDNKTMDNESKITLLKEKAYMMQERSEQKEKLWSNGPLTPGKANVANNYLINSIQAKLAVLNRLHGIEDTKDKAKESEVALDL